MSVLRASGNRYQGGKRRSPRVREGQTQPLIRTIIAEFNDGHAERLTFDDDAICEWRENGSLLVGKMTYRRDLGSNVVTPVISPLLVLPGCVSIRDTVIASEFLEHQEDGGEKWVNNDEGKAVRVERAVNAVRHALRDPLGNSPLTLYGQALGAPKKR